MLLLVGLPCTNLFYILAFRKMKKTDIWSKIIFFFFKSLRNYSWTPLDSISGFLIIVSSSFHSIQFRKNLVLWLYILWQRSPYLPATQLQVHVSAFTVPQFSQAASQPKDRNDKVKATSLLRRREKTLPYHFERDISFKIQSVGFTLMGWFHTTYKRPDIILAHIDSFRTRISYSSRWFLSAKDYSGKMDSDQ